MTWVKLLCLMWRCVWEFPQLFLGVLYFLWLKLNNHIVICHYIDTKIFCGFKIVILDDTPPKSFGLLIFQPDWSMPKKMFLHECGHSGQSTLLGPLYIFVILIPAYIWKTLFFKNFIKHPNYHTFYTERTANLLGGIND